MSWRTAGPLAIPLAMAIAILVAFTQYANPIADPWAEAGPADEPRITTQLFAMDADGTGQRRLTYLPGNALNARWSPDGAQLVYSYQPLADEADPEPTGQLHVMNADGSDDRVLTTPVVAADPAWSPDGARIAFAGSADDSQYDISVIGLDGVGLEQLTDDEATDFAAAWTPDGSALLFNSDVDGDFDIVRLDLATRARTSITSGPSNDYEPAISPDGTRIAFTSDRRAQNSYDVWLSDIDGGEPTRLTVGTNDDVGDSYMPTWSPDGTRIAFTSNRTGDFEVYVMPAAGGEATNLSQNPATSDGWARAHWSPDGSTIVYPSEGNVPFWRADYVRQGFGAAGVLVASALLAGAVVWLRGRFGALPFGAYAIVIGAPPAMATVLDDQYRLIPGIVIGALAAELVVRRWPAGRSRIGDAIVAFLIPAIVFALYFGTLMMTGGIGWSLHMWLGAIFIAGIVGLFLDELSRAARPPAQAIAA